jgi:hypothetical protein
LKSANWAKPDIDPVTDARGGDGGVREELAGELVTPSADVAVFPALGVAHHGAATVPVLRGR